MMKIIPLSCLSILIFISLVSCRSAGEHLWYSSAVTAKHQNYEFIEQVGGWRVGKPKYEDKRYFMPVELNVSGASNITRMAVRREKDIALKEIKAIRDKDNPFHIQFFVVTCYPTKEFDSPIAEGVDLGSSLKPGTYLVSYLNRDNTTLELGTFTVLEDGSIK